MKQELRYLRESIVLIGVQLGLLYAYVHDCGSVTTIIFIFTIIQGIITGNAYDKANKTGKK